MNFPQGAEKGTRDQEAQNWAGEETVHCPWKWRWEVRLKMMCLGVESPRGQSWYGSLSISGMGRCASVAGVLGKAASPRIAPLPQSVSRNSQGPWQKISYRLPERRSKMVKVLGRKWQAQIDRELRSTSHRESKTQNYRLHQNRRTAPSKGWERSPRGGCPWGCGGALSLTFYSLLDFLSSLIGPAWGILPWIGSFPAWG